MTKLASYDKGGLDIFWPCDETLADSDYLPPSDVITQEIVDDLGAALERFRLIQKYLRSPKGLQLNVRLLRVAHRQLIDSTRGSAPATPCSVPVTRFDKERFDEGIGH